MNGNTSYPILESQKNILLHHNQNLLGVCDCGPMYPIDWVLVGLEIAIILTAVFGNALVIISILILKSLRTPRNYLLLSMAAADLLVGAFVMPISVFLHIQRHRWPFGIIFCNIWISVDIICCTASICHMTAIGLDKYVAITSPFFYKVHATFRTVIGLIVLVWFFALLFLIPFIIFGFNHHMEADESFEVCLLSSNSWSNLIGSVCMAFIPLMIVSYIYLKIIIVLKNRKQKTPNWKHIGSVAETPTSSLRLESKVTFPTNADLGESVNLQQNGEIKIGDDVSATNLGTTRLIIVFRENKGAAMLGIVMLAYLICWTPCFIAMFSASLSQILGTNTVNPSGWTIQRLMWLGYLNSALNPFIYAAFLPQFRQTFKEILMLRFSGIEARTRLSNYSYQTRSLNQTLSK